MGNQQSSESTPKCSPTVANIVGFILWLIVVGLLGFLVYSLQDDSFEGTSRKMFAGFGLLVFFFAYAISAAFDPVLAFLNNVHDESFEDYVALMKRLPPVLRVTIECYHWQHSHGHHSSMHHGHHDHHHHHSGSSRTRVPTHYAALDIDCSQWSDMSPKSPVVNGLCRVTSLKQHMFETAQYTQEFQTIAEHFYLHHKRDTHQDKKVELGIPGFQDMAMFSTNGRPSCLMTPCAYWMSVVLLLAPFYRLYFYLSVGNVTVTFKKLVRGPPKSVGSPTGGVGMAPMGPGAPMPQPYGAMPNGAPAFGAPQPYGAVPPHGANPQFNYGGPQPQATSPGYNAGPTVTPPYNGAALGHPQAGQAYPPAATGFNQPYQV